MRLQIADKFKLQICHFESMKTLYITLAQCGLSEPFKRFFNARSQEVKKSRSQEVKKYPLEYKVS